MYADVAYDTHIEYTRKLWMVTVFKNHPNCRTTILSPRGGIEKYIRLHGLYWLLKISKFLSQIQSYLNTSFLSTGRGEKVLYRHIAYLEAMHDDSIHNSSYFLNTYSLPRGGGENILHPHTAYIHAMDYVLI